MINFRSVSIRGVFNFGRARVLWDSGLLKIFTTEGMMLSLPSKQPVKNAGIIRSWSIETDLGIVNMRGKCMTCGGKNWWNVYNASNEELWKLA